MTDARMTAERIAEIKTTQRLWALPPFVHDIIDDLLTEIARARTAEAALAEAREKALREAAHECRNEMSRARNLAAILIEKTENVALAAQVRAVTLGREDSASRILAAIRALSAPHGQTEEQ